MNEWQPIETAPKDGSEFILFTCRLKDGERIFENIFTAVFEDGFFRCSRKKTKIRQFKWFDGYKHHYEDVISHWMPLPEPPA